MRRRSLLLRFAGAALAALMGTAVCVPGAQAGTRPYRIYMVLWRGVTPAEKGFMAYFKDHHIPADFIIRNAAEDKTKLAGFIKEIKETHPDLVYTFGTTVTTVVAGTVNDRDPATHVTRIPVVFDIVADPLGAGLSRRLSGTGRNLTGVSHVVPLATQVKAIRTLRHYKVLGALYNPLEKNSSLAVQRLKKILHGYDIRFVASPIATSDGKPSLASVPAAVAKLARAKVQLVYLPSDSFIIGHGKSIIPEIHQYGMPTFSATEGPIRKAGALIGIVSNYFTVGQFAAFKATQILVHHRDPGSIPIQTLAKFTFLVNLNTMNALHYYPPVQVLDFAEVVPNRSGGIPLTR